jgi:hypothetical protein
MNTGQQLWTACESGLIRGISDTGDRDCTEKAVPLPEGYINCSENNDLPDEVRRMAQKYRATHIVRTSATARFPGQFYLKRGNKATVKDQIDANFRANWRMIRKVWLAPKGNWLEGMKV